MLKSKSDHSVSYRISDAGIILLVVYVDDVVITGSDMPVYHHLSPFFMANSTQRT